MRIIILVLEARSVPADFIVMMRTCSRIGIRFPELIIIYWIYQISLFYWTNRLDIYWNTAIFQSLSYCCILIEINGLVYFQMSLRFDIQEIMIIECEHININAKIMFCRSSSCYFMVPQSGLYLMKANGFTLLLLSSSAFFFLFYFLWY